MVLEESVVVQPHTGHANIELSLFGDKADGVYSGFDILYADIRPTTVEPRLPGTTDERNNACLLAVIDARLSLTSRIRCVIMVF
jgi:hypothetical protein